LISSGHFEVMISA